MMPLGNTIENPWENPWEKPMAWENPWENHGKHKASYLRPPFTGKPEMSKIDGGNSQRFCMVLPSQRRQEIYATLLLQVPSTTSPGVNLQFDMENPRFVDICPRVSPWVFHIYVNVDLG